MKNALLALCALSFVHMASAQKVVFEEYTLDNGLHVILHQDTSAPVIITSVMYHVGTKNENPNRTGFAHFFEHLLFEGTKNIGRGQWMKIVSGNGGINNANTSVDRTYYYEVFPSNNLELGLWMEAERMLHPVINQIGVDTQKEVVKEEKRLTVDNQPYGNVIKEVKSHLFFKHPYRWDIDGVAEHINAATLEEFQAFNKKFYIPNNAVLVVAGNFESAQAKQWIKKYFEPIKKSVAVENINITEEPITQTIKARFEDPNIQIPGIVAAYRTPSMKTRDARVLELISTLLSDGKSSRLYKKIVDDKKMALQIGAFSLSQEDYGAYVLYGLPLGQNTTESILKEIDEEIVKLQTDLISERDFQKLQNTIENDFVNNNATIDGIAENLATYYLLHGDVNLINTDIEMYRSITREEIRSVAKKYLNPNQRLLLDYVPATEKSKN
ncbi:pitrilysin family protein [Flavobacterium sp.]|uniref:M16 family metallopeptidase n=1 Tax=Flavobacterium sp. TaxID=239 RepID=UPI00286BE7BA|nr:pitrilysin family protein [Flavobacterium sp.]